MKKLIAGISLLAFTWPAWGQYQANDSIVINRPNKVTIITNDKEQEIRVEGSENNPDYSYVKKITLNEGNYAVRSVRRRRTGKTNTVPTKSFAEEFILDSSMPLVLPKP